MQGNRSTEAAGRVIDLDAQLAARMLEPAPVRLGGHVYQVRTDLTGKEAVQVVALFRQAKDVEGWTVVLGEGDAKRLDAHLEGLPKQKTDLVVRALLRASVALADYATNGPDELSVDAEAAGKGESLAS